MRNLKPTETTYNGTLKNLQGVRATSCNDLALLEFGEGGAPAYVAKRQINFLRDLQTDQPTKTAT